MFSASDLAEHQRNSTGSHGATIKRKKWIAWSQEILSLPVADKLVVLLYDADKPLVVNQ